MYKRLFVVVVIQKSINSFLNKYFRRKKSHIFLNNSKSN